MIYSLILRTAARGLFLLMLAFSLILLIQGHHAPGGGFSGGLIGAGAFALYAIAFGIERADAILPVRPPTLVLLGITTSLAAGALSAAAGRAFLEGMWLTLDLPIGKVSLGTPLLFDAGVYLVVVGSLVSILLQLERRHTDLFPSEEPEEGGQTEARQAASRPEEGENAKPDRFNERSAG